MWVEMSSRWKFRSMRLYIRPQWIGIGLKEYDALRTGCFRGALLHHHSIVRSRFHSFIVTLERLFAMNEAVIINYLIILY